MPKINVLIADDSGFTRLLISDILSANAANIEVVGAATDGKDALEKVKALRPDLLLLDMNMGEYDGIYAVKNIMATCPLPILILSAVGNTRLEPIFDALRLGAVDYLNKPQKGNAKIRDIEQELVRKIIAVVRAKPKPVHSNTPNTHQHTFDEKINYDLIVIGASTGGPSAIEEIIISLPSNLMAPVVIVQHMPSNFIGQFVKRLNKLSPLVVVEGKKGMTLTPGMIVVAPGYGNMILKKGRKGVQIAFTEQVFKEFNHPSINALMQSAAEIYGSRTLAALLTGMGKDGVAGLGAIKHAGGYTLAQSRKTSVIYGMPKAAVEAGAVCRSIDLKEIGSFLVHSL